MLLFIKKHFAFLRAPWGPLVQAPAVLLTWLMHFLCFLLTTSCQCVLPYYQDIGITRHLLEMHILMPQPRHTESDLWEAASGDLC